MMKEDNTNYQPKVDINVKSPTGKHGTINAVSGPKSDLKKISKEETKSKEPNIVNKEVPAKKPSRDRWI